MGDGRGKGKYGREGKEGKEAWKAGVRSLP